MPEEDIRILLGRRSALMHCCCGVLACSIPVGAAEQPPASAAVTGADANKQRSDGAAPPTRRKLEQASCGRVLYSQGTVRVPSECPRNTLSTVYAGMPVVRRLSSGIGDRVPEYRPGHSPPGADLLKGVRVRSVLNTLWGCLFVCLFVCRSPHLAYSAAH